MYFLYLIILFFTYLWLVKLLFDNELQISGIDGI
jgi:hypothetical protein